LELVANQRGDLSTDFKNAIAQGEERFERHHQTSPFPPKARLTRVRQHHAVGVQRF